MKLLLTSSGISNVSIHHALVELLGKPVAEANALFIPTAIYPFAQGSFYAGNALWGERAKLVNLGWKSIGLLELTALPGIDLEIWAASVAAADVLLAWGGDPLFLAYWLQKSGLIDLLSSLGREMVYVGVSAGSMAASATFAETYQGPRGGAGDVLASEDILFTAPEGEVRRTLITARGAGWVDFAIIPHFENAGHPDACGVNVEEWAAKLTVPVYAIDDQTAVKITDQKIEVISEGNWKLFGPLTK
ncbi:peptidase S51 [Mucilaginibacter sp. PPCGB 2223]|uniref:Type 1 glutamine amidotransferase-like domain-containing protein n=1 Tax=Mucilaginibacter sp. PPCGB 2223 TaxID=1886027 RepID=UPI0008255D7D|nr:Type 1 glutamine amidotransferase-like domain-containing protein [Mucilaginibacter sp. PPCGB 2223]OCX54060.1 peptidase S51 [Mucilaginibacter sp. PPCGB 2223]